MQSHATLAASRLRRSRISLAIGQLFLAGGFALLAGQPAAAWAADTATSAPAPGMHSIHDIPAGPLDTALTRFGRTAGILLSFPTALTDGLQTQGLRGSYTVQEALPLLLHGTGLEGVREGGVVTIRKPAIKAVEDTDYSMREIRVTGRRDGETEGSHSYATPVTTIGKTAQSLRELPQSVSVITRQRLDDQKLTDLGAAAEQAAGITVQDNGFRLTDIYSRGFAINSFQLDGGAPMDKGFVANVSFDMAQYDRVEILRGPAGLLNGTGNPGGAVNLVRKMPTATPQYSVSASAGSWDDYRAQIDASGPLAFDGKLRGRVVLAYENRKYFIDNRASERPLVYGVLEADIAPGAVLALGAREQRLNEHGNQTSVPRYSNGADLGLPRHTGLSAPWAYMDAASKEVFAKLTWRLAQRWTLRANAAQTRQSGTGELGPVGGGVDPLTLIGPLATAAYNIYSNEQKLLDVSLSGAFDLLGRTHEVLLGADMQNIQSRWRGAYPVSGNNVPVNVFKPADTVFPRPVFGDIQRDYQPWDQKQYGLYGTLRLDVAPATKLIVGARANKYRYDQVYWEKYDLDGNPTETLQLADATRYTEPTKVTPFAGVVYDIDAQWTAYASYAQIFNPQYGSKAGPAPGKGLPPVRGSNIEAGVKGELFDGKVNTAVALYRTVQDKLAISDPRYPFSSELYAGSCCYTASGKVISEGVDAELSGEVVPGLNLSGGYTYNHNRNETDGAAFSSITPRHLLKLWGTWRLPGAGDAWTVGGGTTIQSTQYVSGQAATFNPATQQFNGPSLPFRYTQAGYAVWNAMTSYRIDRHWSVALNVNNVFDKTYYRTVGSSYGGNYYGTPRNASVTLRGQF